MQVLIVVMASLMMLSLMTYSRVSRYLEQEVLRGAFRESLLGEDIAIFNRKAHSLYDTHHVESSQEGSGSAGVSKLQRRLNIRQLFDPALRGSTDLDVQKRLFVRLIQAAYGKSAFYRELVNDYFQRLRMTEEEILTRMIDAMEMEEMPKKVTDLALLQFPEVELRNAFCKMLTGDFDQTVYEDRGLSFEEKWGYPPLGKLVTFRKSGGISVYLAHHAVLMAIFQDPEIVRLVEVKRRELHTLLEQGSIDKERAALELKAVIGPGDYTGRDSELLDYGVSKTRPPVPVLD